MNMDPKTIFSSYIRSQGTDLARNAADMIDRGDMSGIEKLARNVCNSRGIKPEDALAQAKRLFGGK